MTPSRALVALLGATVASIVLALGLHGALPSQAQELELQPDDQLGVEWAYRPADLTELSEDSPATVVAEVLAVTPGPPLGTASASDGTDLTIPTERIQVRVVESIAGTTPATFTLFKLGGQGVHPEGDPAYQIGARYLLFVRRRLNDDLSAPNPDGTWIPVAPDGRLLVKGGIIEPLIDGSVANQLEGGTVDEAIDAVTPPDAGAAE